MGRTGGTGWNGRRGTGWMGRIGRIGRMVFATLLLAVPALAVQPPGQDQFVPVKELPPNEQMPAAPLLITAYAVFLVLVVFYLWTIWRRLNKVDADMRALEQRMAHRGAGAPGLDKR